MSTTVLVRFAGLQLGSLLLALALAAHSAAETLEISVVDEQGRPIEDVAVYATAASAEQVLAAAAPANAAPQAKAIMDQHEMQFVPHLLVVQSGTEVAFPNGDKVSHHVYSFSETKQFELKLYKGDVYPPVSFDRPGVVVLGCNIHDGMLGYIVVVETPYFAKTDDQGVALIHGVPSGDYVLAAWTPRARPSALPPTQQLAVGEGTAAAEIRITGRLAPAHEHRVSSLTWERY
ncbi:MAG TPA: methylamine utilization protein [Rhodanobacteraceae bacterium]|nr:methylamine utilization protein [Rhodanobacteraceae bacterium]